MLKTKDLPESERPYEKCEKHGASSLSDAELLAVIIRTGTKSKRSVELAMEVLNLGSARSGLDSLNDLTCAQLMKIPGIGRVKAIQIQCVLNCQEGCTNHGRLSARIFQIRRLSPDIIWKQCGITARNT